MFCLYTDVEHTQTASDYKTSLLTISDQQGGDSNWEKVRQEVTCAICLELLDDPKSMPCLHTYCKKCLREALAKRPHDPDLPRDRPAINCPLCRAEVALSDQGIEALPTNFSATRLVETVQLQDKLEQNKTPLCDGCKKNDAAASCCDCGGFFLCANCIMVHKNVPATKNHTLMTLKDLSTPKTSVASVKSFPICQKHPEEMLKLYCQDCEILVCRDCVLVTHKNHNYSFVDDVIEGEKQLLKDTTLQELDKILASTNEAINGVEQTQAKVLSHNDQHITQLNKTFQEITDMANKHKQIVLDEINQITKDDLSPLQKQQDNLTMLKKNVEKCHDFTSNTLRTGTNSEIMSARKQMLERTKHLKELHDGSQLSPITKSTKTVSYQLLKINVEIEQVAVFLDLQQCCIDVVPLEIYEKEMATLNVILKDTKGQPICTAANIFTAGITTAGNTDVASSVKELGDGKYSVSFTPVAPVEHVVSIQINGRHITNSPTTILCVLKNLIMEQVESKTHVDVLIGRKEITTSPFFDEPQSLWSPTTITTVIQPLIPANFPPMNVSSLTHISPTTMASKSSVNVHSYHAPYVNIPSQPVRPVFHNQPPYQPRRKKPPGPIRHN